MKVLLFFATLKNNCNVKVRKLDCNFILNLFLIFGYKDIKFSKEHACLWLTGKKLYASRVL